MNFLLTNPIALINALTPLQADFILFCASWIPRLTIIWVLIYLFFRPIPNKCIFAPFENISARLLQLAIVCISAVTAWVLSFPIKNYFHIGRPALLNTNLHPLLNLTDYGFPSSHATVFSAIAVALFFIDRKAGVFAGLLALVIGAARILAGVHTPLDILGGYLLGSFFAVSIGYIIEWLDMEPQMPKNVVK
jgi:membrane-associated phospholipid phosphatase